jgi:hypothetical protein
LLAALCWQRAREITDTLVDLLLHIARHIGARAEEKVEATLRTYAKKGAIGERENIVREGRRVSRCDGTRNGALHGCCTAMLHGDP